ncbi:hypothetical protein BDV96DRAFT_634595 [Lophiotrema nucula]|uniref:Uncharacterized protein n=1 Tax=Lophiotrema nucula TaxID=690887 RepID=A0A6A5YXG8_9PLEO|nr:hypothetical protein BDV96DRAFT_634595 [Lophiotrema nucula]
MRSIHFLIPSLAAVGAAFPTIPLPNIFRRDDNLCPALSVGDASATCNSNGNINIFFGKDSVNLGDRIIDDIHNQLASVCHEHGSCDTNDVIFTTAAWAQRDYEPGTITIQPDGEYPTWIRNGLLDTLMAAVKAIAKCESGVYIGPQCMIRPCDLPEHTPYTQCTVPNYWGINYQGPDTCSGCAPPFMNFAVSMETVDDKLCEELLGAANGLSTIAGSVTGEPGAAVGGTLSGIFTLAALFCDQH